MIMASRLYMTSCLNLVQKWSHLISLFWRCLSLFLPITSLPSLASFSSRYGELVCHILRVPVPGGLGAGALHVQCLVDVPVPHSLWHRYINDVFIVWHAFQLEDFVQQLGINNMKLAFTMECSNHKIPFLGIWIQKDSSGMLISGLFRKLTVGNTLLHTSSSHPAPLLSSIRTASI